MKNYKIQNTNYKQITNYKLQNTMPLYKKNAGAVSNYKSQITKKVKAVMTALIKSFCGGFTGKRIEEKLRRIKASIPFLYANSNKFYCILHFTAFAADSIHLKKPLGGPKGLIGPPCHGAPGRRRPK